MIQFNLDPTTLLVGFLAELKEDELQQCVAGSRGQRNIPLKCSAWFYQPDLWKCILRDSSSETHYEA